MQQIKINKWDNKNQMNLVIKSERINMIMSNQIIYMAMLQAHPWNEMFIMKDIRKTWLLINRNKYKLTILQTRILLLNDIIIKTMLE